MVVPVSPTRRGALAALCGGALLLAGGCDWPGAGPRPEATGPPDPDRGVLEATEAASAAVERVVIAALAAHPTLSGPLDAWLLLHEEHRRVLAEARRTTTAPTPTAPAATAPPTPAVPAQPARALASVRESEAAYAASLAASAGLVRSGRFARLLAVMSAGVGQQLATQEGEA